MTFLVKDIRDRLAASANVVDKVSDRIYSEVAPQQASLPYLILNEISQQPEFYLGGEAGRHTSVIQIDVYTDGKKGQQEANEIAELVRNRLSGFRGTFGAGCYGTSRMIRCESNPVPPVDGSDFTKRRVSMDYEIFHTADVPSLT